MNRLPVGPQCLLLAQSAVSLALGQIKILANSSRPVRESGGDNI